ncbi:MAG: 5-dehydro-4-deoxy-D-glucuronate isomerase [Rikenellaceae bacterium]
MKRLILTAVAIVAVSATFAQTVNYELRYATNPTDSKAYDTERLRSEFLIEGLFVENETNMVYTMHDRMVVGGIVPVGKTLTLETIDPFKANYFLERREIGIINIGGAGTVTVGKKSYKINYKEALYIGKGNEEVTFASDDASAPALFYFNSTPAHKEYPTKFIGLDDVVPVELGSTEESNHRVINKYIVNQTMETCQLQLGMTELKAGSVWNTMPTHIHDRRMEVYLYFELPETAAISHFMGTPDETRHIWMHNLDAVIAPEWSIHGAAGTSNYTFIWGMGGENLDYGDVDPVKVIDMK